MIRSIIAATVAIVFILQFGGHSWIAAIRQWPAGCALRQTPECLVMTRSAFQASRVKTNEIRYNGRMYDIRSCRSRGNLVELEVVQDRLEEVLLAALTGLIGAFHSGLQPVKSSGAPAPEFAGTTLTSLFLPPSGTCPFLPYAVHPLQAVRKVPVPPPRSPVRFA